MRHAYLTPHVGLREAFRLAQAWAGTGTGCRITIIGPSTSAIEASPWLNEAGLPIGITGNRHSRYTARAQAGVLIAWCLRLDEILDLERDSALNGVVAVRGLKSHAPWITAHRAELLGGEPVLPVPEASSAIKAMVEGISLLPVLNQGLIDSRERSSAVQALTYMRDHGHPLVPDQLAVEAIRRGWPGTSPLHLASLAKELNAGKRLRYQQRLSESVLREWVST